MFMDFWTWCLGFISAKGTKGKESLCNSRGEERSAKSKESESLTSRPPRFFFLSATCDLDLDGPFLYNRGQGAADNVCDLAVYSCAYALSPVEEVSRTLQG